MAVHLGQELGRGELPADHVGLQLGHVDAVGREAAERLVEGRGQVADVEDEAGDHRAVAGLRPDQIRRQDDEAGRVVLLVLDVGGEHLQAVDLGGQWRGDGGLGEVRGIGDLPGGAGGVSGDEWRPAVLPDDLSALAQGVHVAVDGLDRLHRRPGHAHQVEADAQEMLGDDVQAGGREVVVDVGHPPGDGVVDRNHRQLGLTVLDRGEDVLERRARYRQPVRVVLLADQVRVGAGLALIGDPPRTGHGRSLSGARSAIREHGHRSSLSSSATISRAFRNVTGRPPPQYELPPDSDSAPTGCHTVLISRNARSRAVPGAAAKSGWPDGR